jgi:N6-L-threonylcarbamoyladenine synthase
MSFSGLKTAVRRVVDAETARQGGKLEARTAANLAAAFQAAVVETLVAKCARAVKQTGYGRLVIAGGVGANRSLREELAAWGANAGVAVHHPRPAFCTDNGAMIAYAGAARLVPGQRTGPGIIARPRWPLEELEPPGGLGH